MELTEYIQKYRDALLEDVIPFWSKHSVDSNYGGYFTCLNRQGNVYDRDKFIWLQCRQVWLYAMLYNQVSPKQEWLDMALHGARFLEQHGRDEQGHWYFALTQDGRPLVQPYNIFSDCFAAMAFGQLGKATGEAKYNKLAEETFRIILSRRENPKGIYNKTYPGTRPIKDFALPMILSNLVLEVEHLLENELIESTINFALQEVLEVFYQPDLGLILENVLLDGRFMDTFNGRLTCPGHGLESMWFVMDIGARNQDKALIEKAKNIALGLMELGWDQEYGGIYYFLDVKGHPLDRLDWDQKLWWVHQEAMLAMLKGFAHTQDKQCWEWFLKLDAFSWKHFADPSFGEWFGYLNRQGDVLLPLKGGKWKGCFHTPRFLFQGWKTLEVIAKHNNLLPIA